MQCTQTGAVIDIQTKTEKYMIDRRKERQMELQESRIKVGKIKKIKKTELGETMAVMKYQQIKRRKILQKTTENKNKN